jgi:transketolase
LVREFNRPGFELFDYRVYALAGDGDMMEGIGQEAASLAGHLKLDNLCWVYDSNAITIEGETSLAFTEDVATRFRSYGWTVTFVADANDGAALRRAFERFREQTGASCRLGLDVRRLSHGPPAVGLRACLDAGAYSSGGVGRRPAGVRPR